LSGIDSPIREKQIGTLLVALAHGNNRGERVGILVWISSMIEPCLDNSEYSGVGGGFSALAMSADLDQDVSPPRKESVPLSRRGTQRISLWTGSSVTGARLPVTHFFISSIWRSFSNHRGQPLTPSELYPLPESGDEACGAIKHPSREKNWTTLPLISRENQKGCLIS